MAASLGVLGRRERPWRLSVACTVECGWPVSEPISRGPQPVRRRAAQIRCCSASESIRGLVIGREERSRRQASVRRSSALAERHRFTHTDTVDFATFEQAAACSNVRPRNSTSPIRASLPVGVSRALGCCIRASVEVVSFDTHSLSAGPDLPHSVRNVPGHVT
jgi:hypothetical protein